MKDSIIPERERCDCGKKVLNHHWFCDKCYSKKQREKNKRKTKEILKSQKNNRAIKRRIKWK